MRGKVAKELRKAAQMETVGKPYAVYEQSKTGQIRLGDCQRRVQQMMKKWHKTGAHATEILEGDTHDE